MPMAAILRVKVRRVKFYFAFFYGFRQGEPFHPLFLPYVLPLSFS